MRKLTKIMVLLFVILIGSITMNCYGRFILIKKVHGWTGSTFANKYVRSLVWFPIVIFGGTIGGFIDYVILNPLEFWTGSNPLAMAPGESETHYANVDDHRVKMTASLNKFEITIDPGKETEKTRIYIYKPTEDTWYIQTRKGLTLYATRIVVNGEAIMTVEHPDGDKLQFAMN